MNGLEKSIVEELRSYINTLSETEEELFSNIREEALIQFSVFYNNDSDEFKFKESENVMIGKPGQFYIKINAFDKSTGRGRGASKGKHSVIISDDRKLPHIKYRVSKLKDHILLVRLGAVDEEDEESDYVPDITDEEFVDAEKFMEFDQYLYNRWVAEYYTGSYSVVGLPNTRPEIVDAPYQLFESYTQAGPLQYFMEWLYELLNRNNLKSINRLHGFGPYFDAYRSTDKKILALQRAWRAENGNKPFDIEQFIEWLTKNTKIDDDLQNYWETKIKKEKLNSSNEDEFKEWLENVGEIGDESIAAKFDSLNIKQKSSVEKYSELKHYYFGEPSKTPLMAADLIDIVDDSGASYLKVLAIDDGWKTFKKMVYHNILNQLPHFNDKLTDDQKRKMYNDWQDNLIKRYETAYKHTMAFFDVETRKRFLDVEARDVSLSSDPNNRFIYKRKYLRLMAWIGNKTDLRPGRRRKKGDGSDAVSTFALPTKDEINQLIKSTKVKSTTYTVLPDDIISEISFGTKCTCGFQHRDFKHSGNTIECRRCETVTDLDKIEWISIESKSEFIAATSGYKTGKDLIFYLIKIIRTNAYTNTPEQYVIPMYLESGIGYDIDRELLLGIDADIEEHGDKNANVVELFDVLIDSKVIKSHKVGPKSYPILWEAQETPSYFKIRRVNDDNEYMVYFKIRELGISKDEIDKLAVPDKMNNLVNKWNQLLTKLVKKDGFRPKVLLGLEKDEDLPLKASIDILEQALIVYLQGLDTSIIGDQPGSPIQPPELPPAIAHILSKKDHGWFRRFPINDTSESIGAIKVCKVVLSIIKQEHKYGSSVSDKIKSIMLQQRKTGKIYSSLYGNKKLSDEGKLSRLNKIWKYELFDLIDLINKPRFAHASNIEQHAEKLLQIKMGEPSFNFSDADLSMKERAIQTIRSITKVDIDDYDNRQKSDEFSKAIESLQIAGAIEVDGSIDLDPETSEIFYTNLLNLFIENQLKLRHTAEKRIFDSDNQMDQTFDWATEIKNLAGSTDVPVYDDDKNIIGYDKINTSNLTPYGITITKKLVELFIATGGRPAKYGIAELDKFYKKYNKSINELVDDIDDYIEIDYDNNMVRFHANIDRAIVACWHILKFMPPKFDIVKDGRIVTVGVYTALNNFIVDNFIDKFTVTASGQAIKLSAVAAKTIKTTKLLDNEDNIERINLSDDDLKVVAVILDNLSDKELVSIIKQSMNLDWITEVKKYGLNIEKLGAILTKLGTNYETYKYYVEKVLKQKFDDHISALNDLIIRTKLTYDQIVKTIGKYVSTKTYQMLLTADKSDELDQEEEHVLDQTERAGLSVVDVGGIDRPESMPSAPDIGKEQTDEQAEQEAIDARIDQVEQATTDEEPKEPIDQEAEQEVKKRGKHKQKDYVYDAGDKAQDEWLKNPWYDEKT